MTIEKGFIVNGWFNLFALSGVSLQYKVSDGTILWDGPVSLDSAIFSTSSTKISRISLPVSKRKEYNGGSYSWMAEDSQIYVYGWFGPASSSEIVCQPSSLGYFTRLVNYNTPGLVNGSDPSPSFFLQMNVASTPPTAAQLSNIASASSYAVATYGQTSSGVCSGYTELSNKISLNQSQFDGQGRDGASAFFPPFTKTGSQSSPFAVQASAGQFFISGTFLPNIYPALADGLNIYKRTFNDNWEARDSLFFCSSSAINDAQFSLVSQVGPGLLAGSGILPYTPVLASGEQSYSGSAVLVCPTKNGILLEWGQVMKGNNFF